MPGAIAERTQRVKVCKIDNRKFNLIVIVFLENLFHTFSIAYFPVGVCAHGELCGHVYLFFNSGKSRDSRLS